MKNCDDIKNSLPLYLDNSLTEADKKTVEEHIKTCPDCTEALTQLSKTKKMVSSLTDVNPPPWFKQKIMARVREEAEKKSFVQKLFYPLQIKIPIQVFATVCIAVLAVYIYRTGEEQMKEVVPSSLPAPVMEVQKSQLPEQKLESSTGKVIQKEEQLAQKEETRREIIPSPATTADAAKDIKRQATPDFKTDRYESAPAAESELEKKKSEHIMGAAVKASGAPQAQSSMMKPNILLKVSDIYIAAEEVEKLLTKYEATNIDKQMKNGKTIITAELKNQKIRNFMENLKTVGQIREENIPSDNTEENITLTIEILKQ
ncbi:MAG: DUF2275 domain-containing protein [Syntrophaceae bacterium]|nr:DUF2275 domain-containing protein [Syntrophaceae bacterium]